MKFTDLNELEDGSSIEADLCIVGSGPAGVSIAKEFAGSKVQVLIVEGGGLQQTSDDEALFDFENIGVCGQIILCDSGIIMRNAGWFARSATSSIQTSSGARHAHGDQSPFASSR